MIDSKFVKDGLLKSNYFPLQKNRNEELPSIFNSTLFSAGIADQLVSIKLRNGGYDDLSFNVTRFNNVHRKISIPHPLPYAHLVNTITKNWNSISHIEANENSIIRPLKHKDGRIIVMTYEQSKRKTKRYNDSCKGKKFIVHSDISNFYPSIYTHSIPWALLGVQAAKLNQNSGFENELDQHQRMMKRNETTGVAIGPGTSNIISEIILFEVDKLLKNKGYEFYRFIDDYTAFCTTYEESESFIRDLSDFLSIYGLLLNIKKTEIKKLPKPTSADWVSDLGSRISQRTKVNEFYCIKMLDYALDLQEKNAGGSILKFTLKSLINKATPKAKIALLDYAVNLTMHYPILLPLISDLLSVATRKPNDSYYKSLIFTLNECVINKNSDGMVWCLFYIAKYYSATLSDDIAEKIIRTGDVIAITTLYLFNNHQIKVVVFCQSILQMSLFDIDQYWLLLYQVYFDKKIDNPYKDLNKYLPLVKGVDYQAKKNKAINLCNHDQKSFDVLKSNGVTFISLKELVPEKHKKPNLIKNFFVKLSTKVVKKVEEVAT
ncbi:antiviral reverse transcriptase Drt4 [Shewanella morhuae]|uniref:Reverse transcriptase (RNA-dependent DNA polymerase) n=1 Tax=Shewanella morhuae TaxID=365591 RepID=A0A380A5Y3_9GAMM|nr:antiviral reverse transcriptase Drt4 [Shewanella morhuae]SUI74118.1 Reverse transcriptase (RNA-dependent DNA polymerase) [Shewanella morhuae]